MSTGTRLMYSKANQAFVFVFGDQLLRIGNSRMFYRNKADAIRTALKHGLLVDAKGIVTTVDGNQSHKPNEVEAGDLSSLEGMATLRTPVGTRVRYNPNPGSHALYSNPPEDGEEGEVTTVAHIGGRRSSMKGPGGGLLYIKWDRTGTQGVAPQDVEVLGRKGKKRTELSGADEGEVLEGAGKTKRDKINSLDTFTKQYIETALWSTTDNADDSGGEPLDANYDTMDLTVEALDEMIKDCKNFQEENAELLSQAGDEGQNGHDFWLTRNRHGAGFWDRGYDKDISDKLTAASHAYGSVDLTVSGGKIHSS